MRSDTEVARLIDQGLSTPNLTAILGQCLVAGVMTLNPEGRITSATPEIETWTGLQADQLIGQGIAVLPGPLRNELEDFCRAGSAAVRKTIEIEVPGRRARVFQMMALRPTACAPGVTPPCTVVLNDITAVETLETGLELLEKLASIATLSASMAHEIKNAMVTVKTFADVLLKKSQDAELAGLAAREIKRIDSIVSQIMRFSGPAKPTFAAVSVHQLVDQALGIVKRPLEAKQIRLVKL
ncbi:MAG TPA: histidine kinase dimerization/phospho-acceptor domain-containing protein, partial [Methylomirabilota bacterium]|nr:histidine kinase dimerization/phospho-acceptor domain-containing protein [Methylomirabilota bacterium]